MRKWILFMIISFVTLGLCFPSQNASATTNLDTRYTPEQYEEYLANYDLETAKQAGVSPEYRAAAVMESSQILKEFKALSEEEQHKLVNNFTNTQPVIDTSEFTDEESDFSTQADKTISYQDAIKWLGIGGAQTTYKVSVTYDVSKGKVKKIRKSSAYVVRNWNPSVTTALNPGGKSHWVTGDNKAAVEASFYYKIGVSGVGIQIGNVHLKAVGDKNGKRTYKKMWQD
ncbi:hypothetical protein MOD48_09545 [Bacillus spizizenii]|nr:hypothetical protein [Bacillus spizizenii]MCY8230028.1 hypothetical protein [Bacillus spizizenii]MCY8314915.1 hypothetical protein [Bacillus spizizenii]MCY8685779.1 hypothetical protein [Bacillus spizizenii]MCY8691622.1 hypothetical protein [Bacillus spizizenii]